MFRAIDRGLAGEHWRRSESEAAQAVAALITAAHQFNSSVSSEFLTGSNGPAAGKQEKRDGRPARRGGTGADKKGTLGWRPNFSRRD
jgi:hypothetical protein